MSTRSDETRKVEMSHIRHTGHGVLCVDLFLQKDILKSLPPVLINVTLLGNRVVTYVIKFRCSH